MIFKSLLDNELDKKRSEFQRGAAKQTTEIDRYRTALDEVVQIGHLEIGRRFANIENIGAQPADELNGSFTFEFGERWRNHEQARAWAAEILENRVTFAADGSQIYAEKETSLPVAAIQIGWFENPHNPSAQYEKNAEFEILSPEDLLKDLEEPFAPETRVGEKRFHAEVAKFRDFLSKKQGWQDRRERMPLAFFDGTLLVSFSLPQTVVQESFIRAMVNLVRHSRDVRVPVLGFVDRSFARDLVTLLDNISLNSRDKTSTLYDAALLSRKDSGGLSTLSSWGSRTSFCYAKRRGLNAFNDPVNGNSLVGFTYLQTASDSSPARLDIPAWIYDDGLLNEVIDVVRAECVVGLGYPYPLEAADQTAVISSRDREIFMRALQEFAVREELNFNVSRKNASKSRRR